jgi:hypothetical protein
MKDKLHRIAINVAGALLFVLAVSGPLPIRAQYLVPNPGPPSPQSQRLLLSQLQSQLHWFDNATSTTLRYAQGADTLLWQHYEGIRVGFGTLTRALTPRQLEMGANDLAELDAGLAIIGEAFANFQDDLSRGRSGAVAFRTLCQVLRDSMKVWVQELNRVAKRLQVGR